MALEVDRGYGVVGEGRERLSTVGKCGGRSVASLKRILIRMEVARDCG